MKTAMPPNGFNRFLSIAANDDCKLGRRRLIPQFGGSHKVNNRFSEVIQVHDQKNQGNHFPGEQRYRIKDESVRAHRVRVKFKIKSCRDEEKEQGNFKYAAVNKKHDRQNSYCAGTGNEWCGNNCVGKMTQRSPEETKECVHPKRNKEPMGEFRSGEHREELNG